MIERSRSRPVARRLLSVAILKMTFFTNVKRVFKPLSFVGELPQSAGFHVFFLINFDVQKARFQ
jgi:hypothetical protein